MMKALISWSSGKDAAFALYEVRQAGELDVVGALTTVTSSFERVSMHGVREEVLDRQLVELGLPGWKVSIPSPCPNEVYEREMARVMGEARAQGIDHVVFGDLHLADIRAYREAQLAELGMTGVFPLWQRDTTKLARRMLDAGFRATLTCVDPRQIDRSFAGRRFDDTLLADLPEHVDPCGEYGEFHTVLTSGPVFAHPIAARTGEIVDRDGFVFADVALAEPASARQP